MTSSAVQVSIHPTAVVDPRAELGAGVVVGPYTVIGPDVVIGAGSTLGPHVVIDGHVRMGKGNRIFPGACIGLEPQDLKYNGAPTEVVIGDDNAIRECVTINRATAEGEQTRIGSGNLLMAYSHLGHNCQLGDRIVVANNVAIAGHVLIGDRAVIGGVLGIHQFVHIGTLAMVGGMSRIDRDIPPFAIVEGHPGRLRGLNRVGLKRSGLDRQDGGEQLRQVRALELLPAAEELCAFLEASIQPGRRGPLPAQRS
jgi:UDP-N-acetylglucosamine acyltransferase